LNYLQKRSGKTLASGLRLCGSETVRILAKRTAKRNVALVAHDNKKEDLVEWADFNKGTLSLHNLYATGTTGQRIIDRTGLKVTLLKSGPYGGDMELGGLIANEELDYLIFFWDPLSTLSHDVDVKALLRVAVLYNVPTACNRATADLIISSPLFQSTEYIWKKRQA
jgi:methylglyoxal synthase